MVRIVENNDWVIITLIASLFAYVFMFVFLLRDIRLKDFLMQKYEESSNNFLAWGITSLVFCATLSVLISQYIPIVPKEISDLQLFGVELNKFGFTFLSLLIFYVLKAGLGFLFYSGVGNGRKWGIFYFTATKFYFVLSIILIILCFSHYYFDIDKMKMLQIYLFFLSFVFVFKVFFYFFHNNKILPVKWYYKILYICTLQIAPLLVLWRLLFY